MCIVACKDVHMFCHGIKFILIPSAKKISKHTKMNDLKPLSQVSRFELEYLDFFPKVSRFLSSIQMIFFFIQAPLKSIKIWILSSVATRIETLRHDHCLFVSRVSLRSQMACLILLRLSWVIFFDCQKKEQRIEEASKQVMERQVEPCPSLYPLPKQKNIEESLCITLK